MLARRPLPLQASVAPSVGPRMPFPHPPREQLLCLFPVLAPWMGRSSALSVLCSACRIVGAQILESMKQSSERAGFLHGGGVEMTREGCGLPQGSLALLSLLLMRTASLLASPLDCLLFGIVLGADARFLLMQDVMSGPY